MATADPKPWHHKPPQNLLYRASALRVFVGLCPVSVIILLGAALQYTFNGMVSEGMWWVIAGLAAFTLIATLLLPRISYLEFTPPHFTLREPLRCRHIAWSEIESGSIGFVVRTQYGIPLFTNIGFRLKPNSQHLTTVGAMASTVTGMHVYFVNLYVIGRDEIVETLRRYQASYGEASSLLSEELKPGSQ